MRTWIMALALLLCACAVSTVEAQGFGYYGRTNYGCRPAYGSYGVYSAYRPTVVVQYGGYGNYYQRYGSRLSTYSRVRGIRPTSRYYYGYGWR